MAPVRQTAAPARQNRAGVPSGLRFCLKTNTTSTPRIFNVFAKGTRALGNFFWKSRRYCHYRQRWLSTAPPNWSARLPRKCVKPKTGFICTYAAAMVIRRIGTLLGMTFWDCSDKGRVSDDLSVAGERSSEKGNRETMVEDKLPQTLDEVREAIDGLDKELIELLVRRQKLVRQAGRLKPKKRCKGGFRARTGGSGIASRRAYAEKAGLSPGSSEAVWRSMIDAFIKLEMETNRTDGA